MHFESIEIYGDFTPIVKRLLRDKKHVFRERHRLIIKTEDNFGLKEQRRCSL